MTWLIDTNIISEVRKGARCHPAVAAWWASVEDRDLFLSALSLGEIRRGVEAIRPRDPAKAAALEAWLTDVVDAFGPRILAVNIACVDGPRASRAVDGNLMQRVACGHVSGLLCGQHDRWP